MEVHLNASEWTVMQQLWQQAPQTLTQLIAGLQMTTDWSASTIKTLIARMAEKGIVRFEGDRPRQYYPAVRREDAAYAETRQLLSRAFGGNIGMLVSNFVGRSALSRDELDELYEILRKAEQEHA